MTTGNVLPPITYKEVLDAEGEFKALELWQGDKYITITFQAKGLHPDGVRWIQVKDSIDKVAVRVHDESLKSLNTFYEGYDKPV